MVRVPGPALAGFAHEIFLKLLKAKREVPGAAERQKTLAAQDGKCALCGCGLTGACELDHVVPVRQAFAGSVQTLQALCGLPQREDAEGERAAHEFGEPRGPRRHGVRPERQAAPSGFWAQTCAKDSTYVGVDVVRCRRNGPLPLAYPVPGGRR